MNRTVDAPTAGQLAIRRVDDQVDRLVRDVPLAKLEPTIADGDSHRNALRIFSQSVRNLDLCRNIIPE